MPDVADHRLVSIRDRLDIAELIAAYADMADRRSFNDADAIFASDVVAIYPGGEARGIGSIANYGRQFLGRFARTQHIITNLMFRIGEDEATVRANLIAVHVADADRPDRHFDLGGIYQFALARTKEGWRISRLELTMVWTNGVPA